MMLFVGAVDALRLPLGYIMSVPEFAGLPKKRTNKCEVCWEISFDVCQIGLVFFREPYRILALGLEMYGVLVSCRT